MCSRFTVVSPPDVLKDYFSTANMLDFPPRQNVAPTQPVVIVRAARDGSREMHLVRWGLIPSWAKDPTKFSTLINARAETASEKASFRGPLRHRRCLIPADGFYEWTGKAGQKQPHLVSAKNSGPVAFAGLWDHWLGADGSEIETMTILTTAANGDLDGLHDRMPLILSPEDFEAWLDCRSGSADAIQHLLQPSPAGQLVHKPIEKSALQSKPQRSAENNNPAQGQLL